MGKIGKRKQIPNRFEVGAHGGCEALLYEFHERLSARARSTGPISIDDDDSHAVYIAAVTFDEALKYLRWREPDFVIDSVRNLGLIVLASGSPLD